MAGAVTAAASGRRSSLPPPARRRRQAESGGDCSPATAAPVTHSKPLHVTQLNANLCPVRPGAILAPSSVAHWITAKGETLPGGRRENWELAKEQSGEDRGEERRDAEMTRSAENRRGQ